MSGDEHFIALDGQAPAPVTAAPQDEELRPPIRDAHFIPLALSVEHRPGQVKLHHAGLDRTVWLPKGQARIMAKSGWALVDEELEATGAAGADGPESDGG